MRTLFFNRYLDAFAKSIFLFGVFHIMITAWSLKDWSFFEEKLLRDHPNCELEKVDNRAFLHVEKLINAEDDLILSSLKHHYDYLASLTSDLR